MDLYNSPPTSPLETRGCSPRPPHSLYPLETESHDNESEEDRNSEIRKLRPRWKSRVHFLLILLGYAIGLSNILRFPYLVSQGGGGSFLVAYLVCLAFIAAPLFFYEMVLGQTYQRSPVETMKIMHPKAAGVAYISVIMSSIVIVYYQVLIAWCGIYLVNSFTMNWESRDLETSQAYLSEALSRVKSPTGANYSPSEFFTMVGAPTLSLFIMWTITCVFIVRGIQHSSFVAYIAVPLPFLLMAILFVKTMSLDGARAGVSSYLTPDLKIFSLDVWGTAASQILFSLSPAMGPAITLASFNPKEYRHTFKDMLIICIANSAFSVFAGFIVFAVLGHVAHQTSQTMDDLADQGPTLAFCTFAIGLTNMLDSTNQTFVRFLSFAFFSTLVIVGFDSVYAWAQTIHAVVYDFYLSKRDNFETRVRKRVINYSITVVMCVLFFLLGLLYCTRGGYYLFDIVDHYCLKYCLLMVAFLEYVLIGWVYGDEQMAMDIEAIRKRRVPRFWRFQMKWIGPVTIGFLFIFNLAMEFLSVDEVHDEGSGESHSHFTYGTYRNYPGILLFFFGWLSFLLPIGIGLGTILYAHLRERYERKSHTQSSYNRYENEHVEVIGEPSDEGDIPTKAGM